jgi:hypothetical protein
MRTGSFGSRVYKAPASFTALRIKKTRGLNRNHNPLCKMVFKDAATSVTHMTSAEPLHTDYERLLAEGTKPNLAKLTIARKLAAIMLAMWKNEEAYDTKKYRETK